MVSLDVHSMACGDKEQVGGRRTERERERGEGRKLRVVCAKGEHDG